jgi:hypothetical protein
MNRLVVYNKHSVGFLQNLVKTVLFRVIAHFLILTQILWGLPVSAHVANQRHDDKIEVPTITKLKVSPAYHLVSSKRITQNLADFTYEIEIINGSVENFDHVEAKVKSKTRFTTVIDDSVIFDKVPRGAKATSHDTFTIRHNCTIPFNPDDDLDWKVGHTNRKPLADAGDGQTVVVGATVYLDGSGSSDSDGDSLNYTWKFVTLPTGSTASLSDANSINPTFLADRHGTYVVQLITNDGKVFSSPNKVTINTINTPPIANARLNQPVRVGQTVQLDGSHSLDVDGDVLTFKWMLVNKPAGSITELSDSDVVNPTLLIDKAGLYTVELVVNDGFEDSETTQLIINTENTTPVSNAGEDRPIKLLEKTVLDGSNSSDIDGDTLNYFWSLITKPENSSVIILDKNAVKPEFTADLLGDYIAQLIVNDGKTDSLPDLVTLSTENTKPIANAGNPQTVALNTTVILDASQSSDAENDTLTYLWSLTSTPLGSVAVLSDSKAEKPQFLVDLPGSYIGQLIVNDGKLASNPTTVTISTENSKPIANAGIDQQSRPTVTVQLDGSNSRDTDSDTLLFSWSLLSIPAQSQAVLSDRSVSKPTIVTDRPGTYVIQLIVNDGKLDSEPDTVVITVENQAPIAHAGPNQVAVLGQTVFLDGSTSSDPDHDSLTFHWRLVTIPAQSSVALSDPAIANPNFVADREGQYSIELTVSDGLEQSTVTITVDVPSQNPPLSLRFRPSLQEQVKLMAMTSMQAIPITVTYSHTH